MLIIDSYEHSHFKQNVTKILMVHYTKPNNEYGIMLKYLYTLYFGIESH